MSKLLNEINSPDMTTNLIQDQLAGLAVSASMLVLGKGCSILLGVSGT